MTEILGVENLLANSFEPHRQFRWTFVIDGIDSFLAKSASIPSLSFGETTIDYINQKRYLAGKGTWDPLSLELYNAIAPSGAQKVYAWIRLCWENLTGRMGYSQFYKKDITLKLLDPVGAITQQWTLQGTWVQACNGGTLDYATEDPCTLALTLRFDQAVIDF